MSGWAYYLLCHCGHFAPMRDDNGVSHDGLCPECGCEGMKQVIGKEYFTIDESGYRSESIQLWTPEECTILKENKEKP